MKKKVLSALLTTAMLASMLVGCGSSNEAPAASTDAAPAASTEAKTEAPASTEHPPRQQSLQQQRKAKSSTSTAGTRSSRAV